MFSRTLNRLLAAILFVLLIAPPALAGDQDQVLVFAAASTTNAVTDICNLFNAGGKGTATPSFASSSTLAKQIENGAPADLFISANVKWMDYLEERDLIDKPSRTNILGNRIVLIAPADSPQANIEIGPGFPLADLLGDGRLAMGDPDHVPAGIYAKQAMEKLDVWKGVEAGAARAKDVRAALALVERGECPLGTVYATDAAISDKVKVVGVFPEDSHPPIMYPAALLAGSGKKEVAKAFFELLRSPEAGAIFQKYGFSVK